MAESVYAADLKSAGPQGSSGFKSRLVHSVGVEADLIIVGGGASGTAVLQALAAEPVRAVRRVVLVERTPTFGPGLPYGETANPVHTMGRTPTLRREKGVQLRRRFEAALAKVRAHGLTVELWSETEALSLRHGWTVDTSRGAVSAPRVVLGVGHWHVHRLGHLSRAIDWRWDERRLSSIPVEDDVVILGMGQSGLDAAVSIALRRAGQPAGKVFLASRSGILPGVYGFVSAAQSQSSIAQLRELVTRERVTLADLFEAVHADAAKTAGRAMTPWTLSALREDVATVDPVALLRRELQRAQASLAERRQLGFQPVLWHGLEPFHEAMAKLSAEDRLTLSAHWIPVMRHVEAIHAGAASRLLGLIEAGAIEVVALGDEVSLREEGAGVEARGRRGGARGRWILDARGPDPRIALSDDRFLQEVLRTGAVCPGRARFEGPVVQPIPETWSVEQVSGQDWLVTGGLWVDPRTFAARDVQGRGSGLFALGPLTVGQFPFYAGLWATRRGAQRIVASLREE